MTAPEGRGPGLFAGRGEVRALAREMDWGATPLGPVETWSPTLRAAVRTCLESPFPINLWCGPELVLIYNDAYRRVLGSKHPGALGRPGTEAWAEIWDQISPMFARIRAGGPPVYADDAPFVVERAGEPEGERRPGEPNAWFTFALSGVRDEEGEVVAFLNVVSESTGRVLAERATEAARSRAERAEARLLDVFAQAPAFMAVLRGRDHVFEYVNNAYYRLVGDRELVGRSLMEALPELRGQGFEELLDSVFATGEPFVGREMPVMLSRTAAGGAELRYVDFVYYPITEADGVRSGVVAHGSDVTDHVLARREAQRARAEAEEANQAKSRFLATTSHEIRTPINAIVGYTQLLEMGLPGPVTEAQAEQLARIQASARHLLGLVDEVLDLAKIEAGGMVVRRERGGLREEVADACRLVHPRAAAAGVAVEDRCSAGDEVPYLGDPLRVRQILTNLLANACKFTPPGGRIVVSCGTAEAPEPGAQPAEARPWAWVAVADTGRGIPPDKLESIFEPFVQAEQDLTRTEQGTGLGLTIARQLARLMGGDLTVESAPGEGSTFTLRLPGAEAGAAEPEPASAGGVRGFAAAAELVLDRRDAILGAYVERMRPDAAIAASGRHTEMMLRNHAVNFLAGLAQSLSALGEGEGTATAMAQDTDRIQRTVAELHGAQRRRMGFAEEALRRDWEILREETERILHEAAPEGVELTPVLALLERSFHRAARTSLGAWQMGATTGG